MDDRGGVTVVGVGTHLAARQALAVPEADAPDVPAGDALGGVLSADRAVPVLTLELEGSQLFAALAADRAVTAAAPALQSSMSRSPMAGGHDLKGGEMMA